MLPQQTWIDIYICVKKANCIWTHNADKRSLMGLTSKMILPPEKPLQDDTTNCVKSCLMKKVPPQGSQVGLHNYRELGHQHSSHNTHDIHLRGWKAQKTNNDLSSFLNTAVLLSPLQIFINNQHEVKTDPIYCLNKLCLSAQFVGFKKRLQSFIKMQLPQTLQQLFFCGWHQEDLHFTALAALMSTSILNG